MVGKPSPGPGARAAQPTWARWPQRHVGCLFALGALLAACGGGGGSDPGAAPPPPPPAAPAPPPASGTNTRVAFTADNAGRVAGYPLWASEHALRLGQALGLEAEQLRASPSADTSGTCGSTGTYRREWSDVDGSGGLSAGDVIRITYDRCSRFNLLYRAQGTAAIEVRSLEPTGAAVLHLVFAGDGMGVEADVLDPRQVNISVTGRSRLELLRSATRYGLVMGGGPDDELVLNAPGWSFAADRMTAFRLEKTQHWDEARTVLNLQMIYTCPELGGEFEVSTPTPLRAWLNVLPEPFAGQGRIEMQGARGDVVRLKVVGAGWPDGELGLELDQLGDGQIDGRGSGRWSDIGQVAGFFFQDVSDPDGTQRATEGTGGFALRRPVTLAPQAVDSTWRIQFTRLPQGAEHWRWRLVDLGRPPFGQGAGPDHPIAVEAQGALFIVRPLEPLRYSCRYELLLETAESDSAGSTVRGVTGDQLRLLRNQILELATPDILNTNISIGPAPAVLFPGGQLTLGAGWLAGSIAPEATVSWMQRDGPALSFASPNERQTGVSLIGSGTGVTAATVELALTLPDGSRETGSQSLRLVFDSSGPWISRIQMPADSAASRTARDLWGGPAVGTLEASVADGTLRIRYVDLLGPVEFFPGWTLVLADGQGRPPSPGRYTGAWGAEVAAPPTGAPRLDLQLETGPLWPADSEFELHEIETDAEGRVTRLALDFIVRGSTHAAGFPGWVRLNSSWPLPP